MKTRKIVLLAACAVLLCICIGQFIIAGHNPVKTLALSETPDTITIKSGGQELVLTQENDAWYIGTNKYAANQADTDSIKSNIKEIRILDSVGKMGNSTVEERYDLNEDKAVLITAAKGGKDIRTIRLGKTSSTGSQSYVTVDGGKDIYLVSGNLHSVFGKTAQDIRSKKVYGLDGNSIKSVTVQSGRRTWGVEKNADSGEWQLTGAVPRVIPDNEKADAWVQNLANLSVSAWLDENEKLPQNKEVSVTVNTPDKSITVDVYKQEKDGSEEYICTCSETPHNFKLSSYVAGKYLKTADELKK